MKTEQSREDIIREWNKAHEPEEQKIAWPSHGWFRKRLALLRTRKIEEAKCNQGIR